MNVEFHVLAQMFPSLVEIKLKLRHAEIYELISVLCLTEVMQLFKYTPKILHSSYLNHTTCTTACEQAVQQNEGSCTEPQSVHIAAHQ